MKSDGLSSTLKDMTRGIDNSNIFFFDMSIPDHYNYIKHDLPTYSRVSDVEHQIAFEEAVSGIWLDNFGGKFEQVSVAKQMLVNGFRVAFVSPELHKRSYEAIWREIKGHGLHKFDNFELCTDHPELAFEFFGD